MSAVRILVLLVACVAMAPGAQADEPKTAADVTEPGRTLRRALDVLLAAPAGATGEARTLVFLVDATPALASSGLADELADALDRAAKGLARTRIGVARSGGKGAFLVKPTTDHPAIVDAVRRALGAPSSAYQNLMLDARKLAASMGGRNRHLAIVTLDNGDTEDDLEATARSLRKHRVTTSVVTAEAYLSDSYWLSHGTTAAPPRGLVVEPGGDAAFVHVPWGWIFQQAQGNELAPSGQGPYPMSRLAAETGGRVFLFSATVGQHQCAIYGSCSFCTNVDHKPVDRAYQVHRVKALAATVESRKTVLAEAAQDPWFRATLRAWQKAEDAGLVRSKPSVKVSGGALKPEKRRAGAWVPLLTLSFKKNAQRARRTAETCEQLAKALAGDLEGIDDAAGAPRYRGGAEYTLAMLHLSRFNLLAYAAWCDEVGPAMAGKDVREIEPPELPWYGEDQSVVGVSYSNMSLCHGVRPFHQLYLPGGDEMKAELDRLERELAPFFERHARTPYGIALRRVGLARFYPTFRGKYVKPTQPDRGTSTTEKTTTETSRPGRAGGAAPGGSSSGPTTGGG